MKNKITLLIITISCFVLVAGIVDLNNLFNYANQVTPSYVYKDNTPQSNPMSDAGATLGRVLFYDKKLSVNNAIACASCHLQAFAFGDTTKVSVGVNGVTGRHSMRLVNARFTEESNAFWDERASSLEDQATKPIQDHVEMGYSGKNGDPGFNDLIHKLEAIDYYNSLFDFVYGDSTITEERVQKALAQFVRSIQSYDSKFDIGRAQVTNNQTDFPNFTDLENMGKNLFFTHPPLGGAGCARCHSGAEFTIITNCNNNGVIGVANDTTAIDLTNTKAPSLRNLVNPQGMMNGPFMHNGSLETLMDVINHYDHLEEVPENTNLDFRLSGTMHHLELTDIQKEALVAFLKTLTGVEVYTAEKWSNPFDEQGNIKLIPLKPVKTSDLNESLSFTISPNPTSTKVKILLEDGYYQLYIIDMDGKLIKSSVIKSNHTEDLSTLPKGTYIFQVSSISSKKTFAKKVSKI